MRERLRPAILLASLALGSLQPSGPTHADPGARRPSPADRGTPRTNHIVGMRITPTDTSDLTVEVDISVFYTLDRTQTVARLGTTFIPAFSWGDTGSISAQDFPPIPLATADGTIHGTPARIYRGSFSHTYGFPRTYRLTAANCCAADPVVTGSVTTIGIPTYNYIYTGTVPYPFVFARAEVAPAVVLADGFESGDLAAWSLVLP